MGSACCVAFRDRAEVPNRLVSETLQTNTALPFPSRSLRGESGEQVAGQEVSLSRLSDGVGRNIGLDSKNTNLAFASEGSPLDNRRKPTRQRSPVSDRPVSRNTSTDAILDKRLKEPTDITASSLSPTKFQLPLASQPSRQESDGITFQENLLNNPSGTDESFGIPWRNESLRRSFDNESFGFDTEKFPGDCKIETSDDQKTCGACSMLLMKKSLWSTGKIITTDKLPVVAVLTCGHVYHAECLDPIMTGSNRYDPQCPICTFGEKKTHKLSEKALRAATGAKAKSNKRSRNRVMGSDGDNVFLNHNGGHEENSPKSVPSSSMKSYAPKHFLTRHFSFGSTRNRGSPQANLAVKKKGLFLARSCRI